MCPALIRPILAPSIIRLPNYRRSVHIPIIPLFSSPITTAKWPFYFTYRTFHCEEIDVERHCTRLSVQVHARAKMDTDINIIIIVIPWSFERFLTSLCMLEVTAWWVNVFWRSRRLLRIDPMSPANGPCSEPRFQGKITPRITKWGSMPWPRGMPWLGGLCHGLLCQWSHQWVMTNDTMETTLTLVSKWTSTGKGDM